MVSCRLSSTQPLANTTPVTPPIVKRKMKPIAQTIGVLNDSEPPHIVAIQENIFTPVGTAITIVAAVKYIFTLTDRPVVNMWCAQTTKPTTPNRSDERRVGHGWDRECRSR